MCLFFGRLVSYTTIFSQWDVNEVHFFMPQTDLLDHPRSRVLVTVLNHEPILNPSCAFYYTAFSSWLEARPLRNTSLRPRMGDQANPRFFY